MKFSIIIPFYNHWKLVHDRLLDLYRVLPQNPQRYEVVIYNDGSSKAETSDARHGIRFWKENDKFSLKYVESETNNGFGFAMNAGVDAATNEVVCLLSNDVEVNVDFTVEIEAKLERDNQLLLGDVMYWDTGWNTIDGTIIPYVNGWFVACTKEAFQDLKGFDWLTFGKFDYEDIDLSLKATFAGMKLEQLDCCKNGLRHIGAQTVRYGTEREAQTKKNREKFVVKWRDRIHERK